MWYSKTFAGLILQSLYDLLEACKCWLHSQCLCNNHWILKISFVLQKLSLNKSKRWQNFCFCFVFFVFLILLLTFSLILSAWWCPSPEDCHLHHSLCFSAGAPPHLHPAGHPAQTTLQSPQHPQEPGSRLVLLRAGLPHRNQPDRQPGEELFFRTLLCESCKIP